MSRFTTYPYMAIWYPSLLIRHSSLCCLTLFPLLVQTDSCSYATSPYSSIVSSHAPFLDIPHASLYRYFHLLEGSPSVYKPLPSPSCPLASSVHHLLSNLVPSIGLPQCDLSLTSFLSLPDHPRETPGLLCILTLHLSVCC